jgi:hypothetical protein
VAVSCLCPTNTGEAVSDDVKDLASYVDGYQHGVQDGLAEIERLRAELEEANITIRALVGAPPDKEKP